MSDTRTVLDHCQSCQGANLEPVLSLGQLPLVNEFATTEEAARNVSTFPTNLMICADCDLVQLDCAISRSLMFPSNYPYMAGSTKVKRENFQDLYDEASVLLALKDDALVIDVGGNDGSFLELFNDKPNRVLNVEPTDVADVARQKGIDVQQTFLDPALADTIVEQHGKAALVVATNVVAHVDNSNAFFSALAALVDGQGTLVVEFQYLHGVIDGLSIDSVYHEHLRYYTLATFTSHLARFGLDVFHARHIPTHGGSLRVYAARPGIHAVRDSVGPIMAAERERGSMKQVITNFASQAKRARDQVRAIIDPIVAKGKRIAGISAAPRAVALLNFLGLGRNEVSCLLEVPGSLKIGGYAPSTAIPVRDERVLFEEQPDHALMFSWHIADDVVPKLRDKGYRGEVIVPLPHCKTI